MSRPRSLKPKLCHHRPSGRAFVVLDGRFVYLGRHGSQESRDAYDRTIGEWISRGRRLDASTVARRGAALTVVELIAAFWQHAKTYYLTTAGTPSTELDHYRQALRPLRRLYGRTPAAEFGPLKLKTVRDEVLKSRTEPDPKEKTRTRTLAGWSRGHVNHQIARLKRVFKWAVSNELIPASVFHGLSTVEGLRRGRSEARETEPVAPVADAHIEAVRRQVSRHVRGMIDLQLVTGMRPGEVVAMRGCDIKTKGAGDGPAAVWVYRPDLHKTKYRGHDRTIYLGPKAQAVLGPFLKPDLNAHIFSPADAESERLEKRRADRATPMTPAHRQRAAKAKRRKRIRAPRDHYDVAGYRRAIARACRLADDAAHKADPAIPATRIIVPTWHPHQLRHNAATRLRHEFGLEAAQVILGHRTLSVTQVYAERNVAAAQRIMGEVG